jgi:hypothetical protein
MIRCGPKSIALQLSAYGPGIGSVDRYSHCETQTQSGRITQTLCSFVDRGPDALFSPQLCVESPFKPPCRDSIYVHSGT